jgi:hypothetical protein
VGSWKHINRVVDGLDENRFAPAVGLMLLDMYLGPSDNSGMSDLQPGLLKSMNVSMNSLFNRFKKR